jgi:hypothetical protein
VLFAKRMHNAWSVANSYITLAQEERDASKHRPPVTSSLAIRYG